MCCVPVTVEQFDRFAYFIDCIYATPGFRPFYRPPVLDGATVVFSSVYRNEWGHEQYLLLEYTQLGYQLVSQGTNRYDKNKKYPKGIFSRFDWAGHYVFCAEGDRVRMSFERNPLNWMFLHKPLADGFATEAIGFPHSKTWLIDDPNSYFISNTSFTGMISQYINTSYEYIYDLLLHQETELPE